jgi:hypothetical protein
MLRNFSNFDSKYLQDVCLLGLLELPTVKHAGLGKDISKPRSHSIQYYAEKHGKNLGLWKSIP